MPDNRPPVRNVVPVETALVEEDGVEVLVLLQVAVRRGEAPSLRTASFVERLAAKTQVVLLASVGLVPKEDVPVCAYLEENESCNGLSTHLSSSSVALRWRSLTTWRPK